jgi:hypothetical protein
MKMKKFLILIVTLIASAVILSSCAVSNIKGKYSLIAVNDESGKETVDSFEYYNLTMTKQSGEQKYLLEYKKGLEKHTEESKWTYSVKNKLSFVHTNTEPLGNREEWNKKDKTITLIRIVNDKTVVYKFKKL